MNEAKGPSASDAPAEREDHLPTTRLPPISPPPGGGRRTASAPPSGSLAPAAEGDPPQLEAPLHQGSRKRGSLWQTVRAFFGVQMRIAPRSTATWTREPPVERPLQRTIVDPMRHARTVRRQVGSASAILGLALAVAGLVIALRGIPADESLAPVVMAALIVARAFASLAVVAFGFGLIRLGERLLDR
jgi:hypothetical protein